jgi:ribosomal subunit interface protein
MKISYSNMHADVREAFEKESRHPIEKLNRLLKNYSPDLVQIHASLEKTPRKAELQVSLNLVLPAGTLHSTGTGADIRPAVKMAFTEIEVQVKKHQQKLRKDYVWKRKRATALKHSELLPAR